MAKKEVFLKVRQNRMRKNILVRKKRKKEKGMWIGTGKEEEELKLNHLRMAVKEVRWIENVKEEEEFWMKHVNPEMKEGIWIENVKEEEEF
jgi:hypothetical protein